MGSASSPAAAGRVKDWRLTGRAGLPPTAVRPPRGARLMPRPCPPRAGCGREALRDADRLRLRLPPPQVPPFRPPMPRRASRRRVQRLPRCPGLRLPLRGAARRGSCRVPLPTRQGARHVAACWVAPPARRETPCPHPRPPRSRCLARHTNGGLGCPTPRKLMRTHPLLGQERRDLDQHLGCMPAGGIPDLIQVDRIVPANQMIAHPRDQRPQQNRVLLAKGR
jgi:hypothetical protein